MASYGPESLRYIHVKIHVVQQGFSNIAPDCLTSILPANQMPRFEDLSISLGFRMKILCIANKILVGMIVIHDFGKQHTMVSAAFQYCKHQASFIKSLDPGRCGWNFISVILKRISWIDVFCKKNVV